MSDKADVTEDSKVKEDTAKATIKEENQAKIDGAPAWQVKMWEEYNDDYAKQISQHCYDKDFAVQYNNVETKTTEDLLFSEPIWVDAKLILKNMSTAHTDHCDTMKTEWIQLVRNASMKPEEYEKMGLSIPLNYNQLNIERKRLEKQYYEEATRIMFKIKIQDQKPREIAVEDYQKLERVQAKFAVDSVHLSFAKPEPKNAKVSSSLYT